ncbi:hypothetical protein GGX14DRAFT_573016 [Mycena pura]|uniref:Uncharacterized protein n=1 Tax=Mycena pura TaxID=153505 RepID=A0AAD6V7I7_9AGAR|nr:hypothetical protein GGX14DRAFT_573016 [Mycena pura]
MYRRGKRRAAHLRNAPLAPRCALGQVQGKTAVAGRSPDGGREEDLRGAGAGVRDAAAARAVLARLRDNDRDRPVDRDRNEQRRGTQRALSVPTTMRAGGVGKTGGRLWMAPGRRPWRVGPVGGGSGSGSGGSGGSGENGVTPSHVPSGDPYTGFSRASTLSAGAIIGICVVALIVASLISFNFYCRCLAICCPGCLPCRCCQEEEEEDWNVLYNENPNVLYNENPDVSGWPRIACLSPLWRVFNKQRAHAHAPDQQRVGRASVHTPPVPVTPPPTPVPVPADAPDSDDGSERDAREARRNEYSASAESPIDPWRYVGATLPTQLPRAYAGRIYAHHHPIKMQVPPEAGSTTSSVVGSDPGAHFHTFRLYSGGDNSSNLHSGNSSPGSSAPTSGVRLALSPTRRPNQLAFPPGLVGRQPNTVASGLSLSRPAPSPNHTGQTNSQSSRACVAPLRPMPVGPLPALPLHAHLYTRSGAREPSQVRAHEEENDSLREQGLSRSAATYPPPLTLAGSACNAPASRKRKAQEEHPDSDALVVDGDSVVELPGAWQADSQSFTKVATRM